MTAPTVLLDLDQLSNADWQLAFEDLDAPVERTTYGGACHCVDLFDHILCINETPVIAVQARQVCEQ